MTQTTIRIVIRWIHIALGLILLCYVYSPWGGKLLFKFLIKFLVIPVIVLSGIWLWKFSLFNKWFRIRS